MHAYPDPLFDKQFRIVDDTIMEATEIYSSKIGKEHFSSSYTETEMIELINRMLAQQDQFIGCIAYNLEFGDPSKNIEDRNITHQTKRVHIVLENGRVTCEVIKDDCSEHGHNVFVPERLHHLN